MERSHWGQHGDECFACKIQSIQFDPYAMPSRLHPEHAPKRTDSNSWERGIPTDKRGMPVLREDGSPMGQKEFSERRSQIEESKRRLHNAPATPS